MLQLEVFSIILQYVMLYFDSMDLSQLCFVSHLRLLQFCALISQVRSHTLVLSVSHSSPPSQTVSATCSANMEYPIGHFKTVDLDPNLRLTKDLEEARPLLVSTFVIYYYVAQMVSCV